MLVATVFAGLLVTACGAPREGTDSPVPSIAPTPAPTMTPRPTPEPDPTLADCPPSFRCPILPGEHSTGVLGATTLTLTVESEWQAMVAPEARSLAMGHMGAPPAFLTAFVTTGEVFSDPCNLELTAQVPPTPDGILGWLAQHPELDVSEPQATVLGGLPGFRVEITAMKAEPCRGGGLDPTEVLLFSLPGGDYHQVFDQAYAVLFVLEAGSEVLIVSADASLQVDRFDLLRLVEPVFDSMIFTFQPAAVRWHSPRGLV